MLKSYIPGIKLSFFPKKHYNNIFSEKLVKSLHARKESQCDDIHYSNVSDSIFVKN